ncbi:CU044_5270 family protein [Actinomadura xylanilytica]|uniref:CU044_5270 family protein n=1 Tax=Actinomadura xylanilytica TaxID=887459 RepID=UPI00255A8168|nr:CU044_5270 family protein [Actinomadura xylanilytica]MDL4771952.1 CU044_5270 family protein [Actinomadura xylanilytica]
MDELDALRGMRTTLAEQENPDRLALRTNWRRPAPARRSRRGLKISMVSVAATAAVVGGSVAAISMTSDGKPSTGETPVLGNALLVAATNAQKAPDGAYWHTSYIAGHIDGVGTKANHYKVDSQVRYQAWTDKQGNRASNMSDGGRPLTAEDERKWEAAGSPKEVTVPVDGGDGVVFMNPMPPRKSLTGFRPDTDWRYFGLTPQQVAALPTDAKALENYLLDLKGDWKAFAPKRENAPMRNLKGTQLNRALSDVASSLLAEAPSPPKVRAAAFRMLAGLPGLKTEGTGTDPLGRTGTVVSLPVGSTTPLGIYTAPKQLGTYRRQWIIDPASGLLLATRDLVMTPPHGSKKLPPGDDGKPRSLEVKDMPDRFHKPGEMVAYEAYEVTEWTDKKPS